MATHELFYKFPMAKSTARSDAQRLNWHTQIRGVRILVPLVTGFNFEEPTLRWLSDNNYAYTFCYQPEFRSVLIGACITGIPIPKEIEDKFIRPEGMDKPPIKSIFLVKKRRKNW